MLPNSSEILDTFHQEICQLQRPTLLRCFKTTNSMLKCLNLQIMKFDGLVSENMCGDFLLENGRLSRRRKMRLEQAHLMHPWNKFYELFWKLHYFKDERFVEFECRLTLNNCIFQKKSRAYFMGALDAPVQGASFCVERIKLASKLRELY